MDLKTSQTQYTISLDAIDLNFIPTISKYKGHEVTQIWTKKNLTRQDNQYYEFQIMEENENVTTSLDEKLNQTLTPCHICNVDIPHMFVRHHLNSNKHKTFKKIIDASLDRMNKILSNEIIYEAKHEDESLYFCESCVSVVNLHEKNLHENSLMHKKSLAADKILNDFLDLYTDNRVLSEGIDEESIKSNCINNTLIRINSKTTESNGNKTCGNLSTNSKIKESTYTNNASHKQLVTLSKEKQTVAQPANDNFKCLPISDGSQNKEKVLTLPSLVVLNKDTYIKDNEFHCGLCNYKVPNHNYNIYTHLVTAKHINNTKIEANKELINVHYHMDLTKLPQLECFVCKKILSLNDSNINNHVKGNSHKQKYKLILGNNRITIKSDIDKCICNVCDVFINPMHELIHCQTHIHLAKLASFRSQKNTNTSIINQENDKIKKYLLKNYGLEQQICLVCNVKVSNGVNNVKTHLEGRVHNEKYNTILSKNKIHSQGNNFKCEQCDIIVHTGSEIQHIQTHSLFQEPQK